MELSSHERAELLLKQKAAVQFLARIALAESVFISDEREKHQSINEEITQDQTLPLSTVSTQDRTNVIIDNSNNANNPLKDVRIHSIMKDNIAAVDSERGVQTTDAGFVRYPPSQLMNGSSVFEHALDKKSLLITFATSTGAPLGLFSVIPFSDTQKAKAKKKTSQLNPYLEKLGLTIAIDAVKRKKAESYAKCLEPAYTLCAKNVENSTYNPFFLDDPELKVGRHKTVITLPFFLGSIIQPSKPADIKKELNEHFKETHPTIDGTITLSQIRNLKAKLLEIGIVEGLELSSVAMSYVYFEKLILKNIVTKVNRRLIGAISLLLAAKVNDPKELDYARLLGVWRSQTIEKVLDIVPKDILAGEFSVYSALEFSLFIPLWDILPHLERIMLQTGDSDMGNVEGYLGNTSPFYKELKREPTNATI